MSLEQEFREVVRREVAAELAPVRDLLEQLQNSSQQLSMLTQLAERLAPLLGVNASFTTQPRRRGRPPGSGARTLARAARPASSGTGARRGPKPVNNRPCAIIGCHRPSRTKGYCAAHYQKLRNLAKTNRLPSDWKDFADPHSVKDLVLPRGRAASKALKSGKE
ncbi:MAG: cell wall protein [Myxococcaceae bacterium]